MENQMGIPAELYDDEVIGFLADRYHSTPDEIVQCFLVQDGRTGEADRKPASFRLEDNEMEIMRGLTKDVLIMQTQGIYLSGSSCVAVPLQHRKNQ